jgi:hypothetical protein
VAANPLAALERLVASNRRFEHAVRPTLEALGTAMHRIQIPPHNRVLARQLTEARDALLKAKEEFLVSLDQQTTLVHALEDLLPRVVAADRRNAELEKRVAELESDLAAWQRQYEPESDLSRPSFFSNIRAAFSALFGR